MRRLDCVRNLVCAKRHRQMRQWNVQTRVPSFSAAYCGHTVRHYTRASRGLVDMKPLKQIIFNPHLEREIKLVRL